jgi:hypothetical protein
MPDQAFLVPVFFGRRRRQKGATYQVHVNHLVRFDHAHLKDVLHLAALCLKAIGPSAILADVAERLRPVPHTFPQLAPPGTLTTLPSGLSTFRGPAAGDRVYYYDHVDPPGAFQMQRVARYLVGSSPATFGYIFEVTLRPEDWVAEDLVFAGGDVIFDAFDLGGTL